VTHAGSERRAALRARPTLARRRGAPTMNLPRRSGHWRRLASVAVASGVTAASALLAASASGAPDPSANIALGPLPASCSLAPTGGICEAASVARLNAGRARLGLGPYLLPKDFDRLLPVRQWLILANLDRIAYSLPPISGVSVALNLIARQGAEARRDPDPRPALEKLSGQAQIGFASNWAGGAPNAPVAYFSWMYDDGYGSGNIDCTSATSPGCWGHRHTILAFGAGVTLTLGGAAVPAERSFALTVVETSTAAWPYSYTWAAAKADGAASH
jgi:hypothetical protein